jgi:hypothetical protein
MKKYLLCMMLLTAAYGPTFLDAQVTRGTGGSIGANVPTTNLNTGVNYTNPQAALDVKSEVRVTSTGGTNWLSIATPGTFHTITSTNNMGLVANNNAQINFTLGSAVRTTMLSNGWVGIGIASASGTAPKLHVHNGSIMVSGSNSSGGAMITFSDNVISTAHPNGRWGIEYVPNSGLNFWQPWNPTPGGGSNYALFLKDDQKVGMGIDPTITNSFPAGYRLYVKDGILTEKLKIAVFGTANWADFVFADDYKLRPLSEVEAFVKENKHLPEVPSAQNLVEDGGVDVQSMLAKQMQKIEELTLYIIAQDKKIQALENKVNH